ncbi:MAG TPA: zf-HC2 domain-containing protein [Polyangiaceae bacterium]|nr:zf-HC2 domain-containing protein [Polyangiaceae bacterium]
MNRVSCPMSHEQLVRYWAHDLTDEEADAIDEHLFECVHCFETAGQVAALATGVREALPPVATERDVERARKLGSNVAVNTFTPEQAKEAWFHKDTDVLVHRLQLPPAVQVAKASVQFTTLDGTPLLRFDDVPCEDRAVLITCQRHYSSLFPSPDNHLIVETTDASGKQTATRFTVLHRFE